MSAMGPMPISGTWTVLQPGGTWPGEIGPAAAASFLGMWMVMMAAMMLPSLAPTLWRCREVLGRAGEKRPGGLIALAGVGYFVVWTLFGMAAFAASALVAAVEMQWPALTGAVPAAVGIVVLSAGALQFSAWKAHHLASCRVVPVPGGPASGGMIWREARQAWRYGLSLGCHCCACSFGIMATLFAIGIMDLRAMAVVTAAITLERLAPAGERVARAIGTVLVGAGLFLTVQAALFG